MILEKVKQGKSITLQGEAKLNQPANLCMVIGQCKCHHSLVSLNASKH
jgi:hypothetical protein